MEDSPYGSYRQCGKPAVDFAKVESSDSEGMIIVWMCAYHWDEYQRKKHEG